MTRPLKTSTAEDEFPQRDSDPSAERAHRARPVLRAGLKGLGISLLAYFGYLALRDLSLFGWRRLSVGYLAAAVFLSFGAQAAMYLRWWCLLPHGASRPPARAACGVGFFGGLCDYAVGGGIGGMALRAAWLTRRHGVGKSAAAAGVLLDRVLGLATLFVIGAAAHLLQRLPESRLDRPFVPPSWLVAPVLAAPVVALVWPRAGTASEALRRRMGTIGVAIRAVGRRRVGGAVALSICSQLLAVTSLVCVAAGLPGVEAGFLAHSVALTVSEVASAATPIPAGLGVREAAMSATYGRLGAEAGRASAVVAVGSRAATFLATLTGVAVFGVRLRRTAPEVSSDRVPDLPAPRANPTAGHESAVARPSVAAEEVSAGRSPNRGNASPSKVLLVAHYAPPHVGGVEVLVDREARILARAGHEVLLVTSDAGDGRPPAYPPGVRVERVPAWNVLERRFDIPWPMFSPRLALTLWRAVLWCDVVHAHGFLGVSSLLAFAFARRPARAPKRCILTEHAGRGWYDNWKKALLQEAAVRTVGAANVRLAHDCTVCHDRVRETLERIGAGPGSVRLLMFPRDPALFGPPTPDQRAAARRELGWQDGRPKVLFVGRLTRRKGVDVLLDVRDDRFDLVFCGPGDPSVLGDVDGGRVAYFGPRERGDLVGLYYAADVLALPSRAEGNLPLVAQEALCCGLPVVLADDPGLSRFRRPGLSFCGLDPASLRDAILAALAGGRLDVGRGEDPLAGLLPTEAEWVEALLGPAGPTSEQGRAGR